MTQPSRVPDRLSADTKKTPGGSNRGAHRMRTLKQAKAILSESTTMDCRIKDLTPEGARLDFGTPCVLPENFRLLFITEGVIVPVHVQWHRGNLAGVHFTGPQELAPATEILRHE